MLHFTNNSTISNCIIVIGFIYTSKHAYHINIKNQTYFAYITLTFKPIFNQLTFTCIFEYTSTLPKQTFKISLANTGGKSNSSLFLSSTNNKVALGFHLYMNSIMQVNQIMYTFETSRFSLSEKKKLINSICYVNEKNRNHHHRRHTYHTCI